MIKNDKIDNKRSTHLFERNVLLSVLTAGMLDITEMH